MEALDRCGSCLSALHLCYKLLQRDISVENIRRSPGNYFVYLLIFGYLLASYYCMVFVYEMDSAEPEVVMSLELGSALVQVSLSVV